jgi:hypothetical protein
MIVQQGSQHIRHVLILSRYLCVVCLPIFRKKRLSTISNYFFIRIIKDKTYNLSFVFYNFGNMYTYADGVCEGDA